MLVPPEAVRVDGATGVVFVYAAGKVERRSVTLGETVAGHRQVLSGLRDGERVVLSPPESLKDGQTVKLATTAIMSHLVEIRGLTKTYVRGREKIAALYDITLDIPRGDFVALMGPSGSGKTTLLNLIGGLTRPPRAASWWTASLDRSRAESWRAGALPMSASCSSSTTSCQCRRHSGMWSAVVTDQFGGPATPACRDRPHPGRSAGPGQAQAQGALRGQEQRVAIARAIVSDPTLLVCDEPTGDPDRATADEILTLLQMLNREHDKTVVMVTHDPKAAEYARRQLHLDKGILANGWEAPGNTCPSSGPGCSAKSRTVLTLVGVRRLLALRPPASHHHGLRVGRRQR